MIGKGTSLVIPRFLSDRRAIARILAVTGAFAIAGFAYGFVAPRWYRSTTTIVPATPSRAVGVSSLLGPELGGLAAGLGGIGASAADAARIVAVLQSNGVTDAAIDKFDLMARYRTRFRESAREAVWRHCEAKAQPKPNLVQLSCEDTDPRFAQELVAFLADHGNQAFRRVNQSSASEEVRFLDARAAELRKQADTAATKVREFQEAHQLVDLDTQAKAVVTAVAALNTQKISKQLELEYAQTFSSRDEATTRQLKSQLEVVDEKLLDLEENQPRAGPESGRAGASRSGKTGMFPPALAVPKLRADYEKLFRDRKVAEATLVFVLERLEAAKANEARNVSTFQILDPASLPTRKTRPSRLLLLAGAVLIGLVVSMGFEWWRSSDGLGLARRLRGLASPSDGRPPPDAAG